MNRSPAEYRRIWAAMVLVKWMDSDQVLEEKRQQRLLYKKRWRSLNKERMRLYSKRWYYKNKEKKRASVKRWMSKNTNKVRESHNRYYERNADKIAEKYRLRYALDENFRAKRLEHKKNNIRSKTWTKLKNFINATNE